ncbi:MAG: hypothetical protein AAGD32_02345 [Planctomycetota bacterium]
MNTSTAISTLLRDLTVGRLVHKLLLAVVAGLFVYSLLGGAAWSRFAAFGLVTAYFALTVWSLRAGRITGETAQLIAAGRHDEAEDRMQEAVKRFGVVRPLKMATLHQLAVLRHAQGRWSEAVDAGAAFLGQTRGRSSMQSGTELLVAEAALEADDLHTAHRLIVALRSKPLSTDHFAALLVLQLDYQSRLGLWAAMDHNVPAKLNLLDLRPGPEAGRGCALIALAQLKLGRGDLGRALSERATLLESAAALVDGRPLLRDILK